MKKERGKQVLSCLVFLLLLLLVLLALSRLFEPKNNREDFGMKEMKANGILGEKENTIDVIAVGDSECTTALAPVVMWRESGITSYNCGTAGQHLYDTLFYLRRAFSCQKPKVVILETNAIYRECMLSDYLYAKFSELLPVLRYHDRWKSLRAEDLGPVHYTWTDPLRGHMLYAEIVPGCCEEYMKPMEDVRQTARWNRQCLREIVSLCRENGAGLLLLSTPSTVNWNMTNHNGIQALADEYDIDYLDLNLAAGEISIDWQTDTKDGGDHMNAWGAEKVSTYLARYLSRQYALADHRGESGYESWEEGLKEHEKFMEEARQKYEDAQKETEEAAGQCGS